MNINKINKIIYKNSKNKKKQKQHNKRELFFELKTKQNKK